MKTKLIVAALLAAVAGPALAERPWLLPTATIFAENEWVSFDTGFSGDVFIADHGAIALETIKVWQPDGQEGKIENGAKLRYRTVFDVHLTQPGTWKIGTNSLNVMGTFKVDGAEWRLGGRRGPPPGAQGAPAGAGGPGGARPAGAPQAGGPQGGPEGPGGQPPMQSVAKIEDMPANATDLNLTEVSNLYEVFVTAGTPTDGALKPTNKGLEMVPVTHPDELIAGEKARFRFLIDGKPAANLKILLIPDGRRYRDGDNAMDLTTGADGVLAVTWPAAGMYWLNAAASDDHPATPRATARRMSYSATLEVMAP